MDLILNTITLPLLHAWHWEQLEKSLYNVSRKVSSVSDGGIGVLLGSKFDNFANCNVNLSLNVATNLVCL